MLEMSLLALAVNKAITKLSFDIQPVKRLK